MTSVGVEHGIATVAVSDPERAGREILPAIAATGIGIVSVARARRDPRGRLPAPDRRQFAGSRRMTGFTILLRKELAEAGRRVGCRSWSACSWSWA